MRRWWSAGFLFLIPLLLLAGWLALRPLGMMFPETVATGSRTVVPTLSYGYQVEKARFGVNGFLLRFYNYRSTQIILVKPGIELVKVYEQRWLPGDRAVLLRLDLIYHDSIDSLHQAAVLFDYRRGFLHHFNLGGTVTLDDEPDLSLTEEDFEELVLQLSSEVPENESLQIDEQ